MGFISLLLQGLCGVCSHVVVCDVVLVPCVVGAVVVVTVMRVLLFVWEVNILRECEGDGNAVVGAGMCGCIE